MNQQDVSAFYEKYDARDEFLDAFESAMGVRPVFDISYLSLADLRARTFNLKAAQDAGRFA